MRGATASSTLNSSTLPKNLSAASRIKSKEQAKYLQRFKDTEYDSDVLNIYTRKLLRPRAFSIVQEEDDGSSSNISSQLSELRQRKSKLDARFICTCEFVIAGISPHIIRESCCQPILASLLQKKSFVERGLSSADSLQHFTVSFFVIVTDKKKMTALCCRT